ncbi:MAG: hypothetical protein V4697_01470 [Patescibacteria group bacterium]
MIKKYTQGFIAQGIIAIVALVLIAIGAYYVSKKEVVAPVSEDTTLDNPEYLTPLQTLEIAQRVVVQIDKGANLDCIDFDGIREKEFVNYNVSRKFGNGCPDLNPSTDYIALPQIRIHLKSGQAYDDSLTGELLPHDFSGKNKGYFNAQYNFTFTYPLDWKLVEALDKKSVMVSSPDLKYSIEFTATATSAFGKQNTKVGSIIYDPIQMSLVDVGDDPPRCLGIEDRSLREPGISYGGSTMSTPAHFESAILTNKDYMILVQILADENTGMPILDKIRESFEFTGDVKWRLPNCGVPSAQVFKVLSPNGGEVISLGNKINVTFVPVAGEDYSINLVETLADRSYNLNSLHGGTKVIGLATSTQTFSVTIPKNYYNITPGSRFKMDVCSSEGNCDDSDGFFTIVP